MTNNRILGLAKHSLRLAKDNASAPAARCIAKWFTGFAFVLETDLEQMIEVDFCCTSDMSFVGLTSVHMSTVSGAE